MNEGAKTYQVSELNHIIKETIEGSYPYPLWIQGEISDFDKNSKHYNIYFQLNEKDKEKNETASTIKCVLYESKKEIIRLRLREAGIKVAGMDGMNVRVRIRLSVNSRYGTYLLSIEDIDPGFTLGQLAQSREKSLNWLIQNNLLDKNKKIPLTSLPLKIGLITNEGEGYHDFISKLRESGFKFSIYFYRANVQGIKTEREIIAGLDFFEEMNNKLDALVIIRGGGATSDLAWFDNRYIAEKIARSSKPVLTGIGHQTNISLSDLVAHQYFSTPTAVAEFLIEKIKTSAMKLENYELGLNQQGKHIIASAYKQMDSLNDSLKNTAKMICLYQKDKVHLLYEQINYFSMSHVAKEKKRQDDLEYKFDLLDPINIMKRGFSITKLRGKMIKDTRSIKENDALTTILFEGEITSLVKKIKNKS